jgi:dUTP pyrophosphatase
MKTKLQLQKTGDVKTPTRGTAGSAGIDFYLPNDFQTVLLRPHEDILISSYIKCKIPTGYALLAVNKSGVATKLKLQVGACLVDEDYTGVIHLHVFNYSNENVVLNPGDKLIQFILIEANYIDIEVVDNINFNETERGSGGFGSTNNKDLSEFEMALLDQPKTSSETTVQKQETEKKPTLKTFNKTCTVVKIDHEKESIKAKGTYKRTYFRDVDTNDIYILDVSYMCPQFKDLDMGDTITGVEVFKNNKTNKLHIDGKSKIVRLGKWGVVKELLYGDKIQTGIIF